MASDPSVSSFIKDMATAKTALEVHVLQKIIDGIQSSSRGSTSEIIDLAYALTGYGRADIPGGESQSAGACLAAIVKYLTIRANEPSPTKEHELLESTLLSLINETVRLYSEVESNRGIKVVTQTAQRS